MAATEELNVKITADASALDKALASAEKSIGGATKGVMGLSDALAGLASVGIGAFATKAVKMAATAEQIKITFTELTGSAEEAGRILSDILDIKKAPSIEVSGLRESAKELLALGWAADQVVPTIQVVADAVTAVGKGDSEIARITYALGKMREVGKATSRDMMAFVSAGIQGWDILAKGIGGSVEDAKTAVEAGMLSADEAIKMLLEGMEARFKGAGARASDSLAGAFDGMKDAVTASMITLGKNIAEALDLKDVINTFTAGLEGVVKWLDGLDKSVKQVVVGLGALAVVLPAVSLALKGLAVAFGLIQGVLMGPLGIVALVAAAVAGLAWFVVSQAQADKEAKALNQTLADQAKKLQYVGVQSALNKQLGGAKIGIDVVGPVSEDDLKLAREYVETISDPETRTFFKGVLADIEKTTKETQKAAEATNLMKRREAEVWRQAAEITDEVRNWEAAVEAVAEEPMLKLSKRLKEISAAAEISGTWMDENRANVDALGQAYVDMRSEGLEPTQTDVMAVKTAFDELNASIEVHKNSLLTLPDAWETLMQKFRELPSLGAAVGESMWSAMQALTNGIGNSVSQMIVFNENLAKSMSSLLKSVTAQVIASLVALAAQRAIALAIAIATNAKETASAMKGLAMRTFAGAYAATASIPVIGPILAPGVATAATAAMLAGAVLAGNMGFSQGMKAMAAGGIVTSPTVAMIGEAGPEAVIPLDRAGRHGGRSTQTIQFVVGNRVITEAVVRDFPRFLQLHGITV